MRHGESAANVFDRGGAQPDDGGDRLTEHGWAQARGLAERLRGEALETRKLEEQQLLANRGW